MFCLSNAMHGIEQITNHLSVCLSVVCVCPNYLSSTIAIAVFVRSSSNLERRSHIWQLRLSSTANNTRSSKRASASNYFQFSSLLGLCPRWHSHFSSDFYQIWYIHCVSKKVPNFKLSVTLSNLNRCSKICTDGKESIQNVATKPIQHHPSHLRYVATLPWET